MKEIEKRRLVIDKVVVYCLSVLSLMEATESEGASSANKSVELMDAFLDIEWRPQGT